MPPSADYLIRQGDAGETITATLTDSAGAAVDIAGATVEFVMVPVAGGAAQVDAAATNAQVGDGSDGSKGYVSYTWLTGDTDTAGNYLASWVITFAGGAVQTYPNGGYTLIAVTADDPVATATRFASSDDLAARLGIDFTADEHVRANKLLTTASGLIQDATGKGAYRQTIALVTDDVLSMPGTTDEMIKLPQRPVGSVSAVTLDGTPLIEGSDWYRDGNMIARIPSVTTVLTGGLIDEAFTFPLGTGFGWPIQTLEITYTHGYTADEIPPSIQAICMEAVVRAWVNPGSVARESVAGVLTVYDNMRFSPTGLLLTDAEKEVIKRLFGRTASSITIGR